MRLLCEVDSQLPVTIRIHTEWVAAFRLSRFANVIRDVRIVVRTPVSGGQQNRFECLVWVRLLVDGKIIVQESAPSGTEAASTAIDRTAAALGRFARRMARRSEREQHEHGRGVPFRGTASLD